MAETVAIRKLTSLAAGSGQKVRKMGESLLRALTFSAADDLVFPQKNLSVSIEKEELSIAYGIRVLSRVTVKKTKEVSFQEGRYPQPDEVRASVALAANEFGASRNNLTLGIPKAWTIIKTADFPSTVKENLAHVIAYELDRLTPFTAEEAFFDYRLLSEDGDRVSVLIMAAKADLIRPYIAALADSGLTVGRIWVNLLGFGALLPGKKNGTETIFLKIGPREYEGAWFTDNSAPRIFSASFLSAEIQDRGEAVASEVKSLLDAAKTKGRAPGVTVLMQGNDAALSELLKTRIAAPLAFLRLPDTGLRFQGEAMKGNPIPALGVMADSLLTKGRGTNLLTKGVYKEQKPPVVSTIVLAVAVIAALAVYLVSPLRIQENRLAEITRQIASKRDEVKKIETLKKEVDGMNAEIESIRGFKEGRPLDLNILKELTTIVPKNTWLTRVRVTETGADIEGYAAAATELLPKLEASPLFRKVEFASPTFRDVRMNADRFVIRMEIEGAKKIEEGAKNTEGGAAKPASGLKKMEGQKAKNEKK